MEYAFRSSTIPESQESGWKNLKNIGNGNCRKSEKHEINIRKSTICTYAHTNTLAPLLFHRALLAHARCLFTRCNQLYYRCMWLFARIYLCVNKLAKKDGNMLAKNRYRCHWPQFFHCPLVSWLAVGNILRFDCQLIANEAWHFGL